MFAFPSRLSCQAINGPAVEFRTTTAWIWSIAVAGVLSLTREGLWNVAPALMPLTNHVAPFFWRFHLVHHVDRDMDASTALRFHFGEHALSIGWRLLQVVAIGPSPVAIWIFHALLVVSIVFHHSNTRLPARLERLLVRLVVTPRMHGIHHSDWRNETNSNWSSLLSAWDYLHRTVLLSIPQEKIVVGVPAYGEPEDVTIGRILAMPFQRQRDDWSGPEGQQIDRSHPGERSELAP